ncbi:MAG: ABC transporter ATP-binding protein [Roseobacter sp.]
MSVSHRYRNFGGSKSSPKKAEAEDAEAIEDQKLQAFEAGYQAGWDDATKAQANEKEKLTADLSQNLLDMSFTYHEALTKLTTSLEPAIARIMGKLLPQTVSQSLCVHIMEQINLVLSDDSDKPVKIVVAPRNLEAVLEILNDKVPVPFELIGEETLGEGQAFIRLGQNETEINLDMLIDEASKAMRAFFHESAQES